MVRGARALGRKEHPLPEMPGASQEPPTSRHGWVCLTLGSCSGPRGFPGPNARCQGPAPNTARSPHTAPGGGVPWDLHPAFSRKEKSGRVGTESYRLSRKRCPPGRLPAVRAVQRLPGRRRDTPSRPCSLTCQCRVPGTGPLALRTRGADSPIRDKETHQNDTSESLSPIQATRTRNHSRTP